MVAEYYCSHTKTQILNRFLFIAFVSQRNLRVILLLQALAHVGKKKGIKVTVVLPIKTSVDTVRRSQGYGAKVVISGKNLEEARLEAFNLIKQHGAGTYING